MEKHIKPERTPENVPYIVHEAEMARQERHIKRLWIAIIVAIVACIAITGGFLWYLNQYDFESYEQDGSGVNIVGNGNGVDFDVPASAQTHEKEQINGEGQSDPQKP
jgi:hypothetical protein